MKEQLAFWIPVAVVILGLIPLLMVWIKLSLNKKAIARATETKGFVEAVEMRTGHKGNRYFVATINYMAGNEMMRGNHILNYAKQNQLTAGQEIAVLYNPNKPKKFLLKDYPYNFKVAWIVTGILAAGYFVLAYFLSKEFN